MTTTCIHYLINLKTRPDRLEKSLETLSKVGITPIIHSVAKPESKGFFERRGNRGNYESHLQILKMICDSDYNEKQVFSIIEDDVYLHHNFVIDFPKVVELFKNSTYDIVFLNHYNYDAKEIELVTSDTIIWCTQFMLITKASAFIIYKKLKEIYDEGERVGYLINFDVIIKNFNNICYTNYCLTWQNNSISDIVGENLKFYIPELQHNEFSNKFYYLTYAWSEQIKNKIYLEDSGYIKHAYDSFREHAWKLVDNGIQIINGEGDLVETIIINDNHTMNCNVWHGHGYCQLELA